MRQVEDLRPDLVAVSYRLTEEDAVPLFAALQAGAARLGEQNPRWVFGGTPPVAATASAIRASSSGLSTEANPRRRWRPSCGGRRASPSAEKYPGTLLERIAASLSEAPAAAPLRRARPGTTIAGARRIAEAGVLDVLSIGPDQNAQEHFFHPEEMDPRQDGAGGVPLRQPEDLQRDLRGDALRQLSPSSLLQRHP